MNSKRHMSYLTVKTAEIQSNERAGKIFYLIFHQAEKLCFKNEM